MIIQNLYRESLYFRLRLNNYQHILLVSIYTILLYHNDAVTLISHILISSKLAHC